MAPLAFIPRDHLSRLLDVCQPRSLPLMLKFQDKQTGVFHRKTMVSLHCALWVGASQELSVLLLQLLGPQMHAPLASRARQ